MFNGGQHMTINSRSCDEPVQNGFDKRVFILAEFEGLSCEEIAAMTGTREQTVWSRLHYARKEFAERLDKRQKAGQR